MASGALVFPPFRAEDYRQEVHAQVYSCLARNSAGTIHSRDVHVRAGESDKPDRITNLVSKTRAMKCRQGFFLISFKSKIFESLLLAY